MEGREAFSISVVYDRSGIDKLRKHVTTVMDALSANDKSLMSISPDSSYPSSRIACRIVALSENNNTPAGFLDLECRTSRAVSAVVAVAPAFRGLGVASSLVSAAVEWLESDGFCGGIASRIEWFAKRINETSIALAEKHGFSPYDGFSTDPEWWGGYRDIPSDIRARLVLRMAKERKSCWEEAVEQEMYRETAGDAA